MAEDNNTNDDLDERVGNTAQNPSSPNIININNAPQNMPTPGGQPDSYPQLNQHPQQTQPDPDLEQRTKPDKPVGEMPKGRTAGDYVGEMAIVLGGTACALGTGDPRTLPVIVGAGAVKGVWDFAAWCKYHGKTPPLEYRVKTTAGKIGMYSVVGALGDVIFNPEIHIAGANYFEKTVDFFREFCESYTTGVPLIVAGIAVGSRPARFVGFKILYGGSWLVSKAYNGIKNKITGKSKK